MAQAHPRLEDPNTLFDDESKRRFPIIKLQFEDLLLFCEPFPEQNALMHINKKRSDVIDKDCQMISGRFFSTTVADKQ